MQFKYIDLSFRFPFDGFHYILLGHNTDTVDLDIEIQNCNLQRVVIVCFILLYKITQFETDVQDIQYICKLLAVHSSFSMLRAVMCYLSSRSIRLCVYYICQVDSISQHYKLYNKSITKQNILDIQVISFYVL